jgi:hypothetical protein
MDEKPPLGGTPSARPSRGCVKLDAAMTPVLSDPPALRSEHLYAGSLATIGLCIGLWIRAKTIGEDERGNAERRALFVGLWPPMFWLIGDTLRRREARRVLPRRLAGLLGRH